MARKTKDEAILSQVHNIFWVKLRGKRYTYNYYDDKMTHSDWCECFDGNGDQVKDETIVDEIKMLVSEVADNG